MDSLPFMAVHIYFFFNCHFHWYLLILRNGNGTASFLNIREGLKQGNLLAMVVVVIVVVTQ